MRRAWIPETWMNPDLGADALRTLIAIALHADKHGVSHIKNEVLIQTLGKEERQIQKDIKKAERLDLISRKYSQDGKRYFQINMYKETDVARRHGAHSHDGVGRTPTTPPGALGGHPPAHSHDAPPNNPLIGTLYSSTVSLHKNTEQPPAANTECVSVSGETSLPQPQPKTEIPEDLKRMASQVGLEGWIGELSFQGESLQDWRVRETLGLIYAQGGKKGSRYAWGIYRNLPKEQPASGYTSIANKEQQEQERIARNLARLEALR